MVSNLPINFNPMGRSIFGDVAGGADSNENLLIECFSHHFRRITYRSHNLLRLGFIIVIDDGKNVIGTQNNKNAAVARNQLPHFTNLSCIE